MIFQSSVRKELARNFSAILIVLITIVMTMTLTQTLGQASRGVFNASDIFIIMGYIVLSDLPTLLSLCLFITTIATLTRMYADSEMIIWSASGQSLLSTLNPILRFSSPIIVIIFILAVVVLPWAYASIDSMQEKYAERSNINRIEPGQFKTSADGDTVFYIDSSNSKDPIGRNVFVRITAPNKITLLTAREGQLIYLNKQPYLQLDHVQEVQNNETDGSYTIARFNSYTVEIPGANSDTASFKKTGATNSMDLLLHPTRGNLAEFSWRIGQGLIAFNFIFLAVAIARFNPRIGRITNLGLAFLIFAIYFNFVLLSKTWIENGSVSFWPCMLILHGGTFIFSLLWLLKRNVNYKFQWPFKRNTS
jgi:lipopolysaccharide export system permease protein